MEIIEIDITEEINRKVKRKFDYEPPPRIVKTPNIEEIANKIEEQYRLARLLPYIKKPVSYAIYKVWEEYDRHEKENEYSSQI